MSLSTIALFCCVDDFAQTYEEWERHKLVPSARKRRRPGKLSLGESLFIIVLFHLSPLRISSICGSMALNKSTVIALLILRAMGALYH